MQEFIASLELFPSNGMDRSLHAPVFAGVLFLTLFKEAWGWTYAGLVVPGYLATVFLAAPLTGGLVVAESILSYWIGTALGRWIPAQGGWSTFFGRERFLLLIVVVSFVRLVVEATLLPTLTQRLGLSHSRELFSLGLVLAPLLANSYWNAGFVRSFPRIGLITGLTYLLVAEILLPFTNFTISRFQVANESVSLAFLESPHAHMILLVGAVLGARNNVRYGWDYNGILVPALLAVAWYEPIKVLTTIIEALLIYFLSIWLLKLPPFSRLLIVGSRRLLLAFSVGFFFKFALGKLLLAFAPDVQMIDYFGFGYLLPSLLAVKMWNKGKVLVVLLPALQVSIIAFPIGSCLGFVMRQTEAPALTLEKQRSFPPTVKSPGLALMLADTAPAPHRSGTGTKEGNTYAAALEMFLRSDAGLAFDPSYTPQTPFSQATAQQSVAAAQLPDSNWSVIAPQSIHPNEDAVAPRFAYRNRSIAGRRWVVVAKVNQVGDPAIVIAERVAEFLGAATLQVWSSTPEIRALDESFTWELSNAVAASDVLVITSNAQDTEAELSVRGALPPTLSVKGLEATLATPLHIDWGAPAPPRPAKKLRVSHLRLPRRKAEQVASHHWAARPSLDWGLLALPDFARRINALSVASPESLRVPSKEELRLFSGRVLAPWFARPAGPLTEWEHAVAGKLGYQLAEVRGSVAGWLLYEPESEFRQGNATVFRRAGSMVAESLTLAVPAPRWERGMLGTAVRLLAGLEKDQVAGLVVHGALVSTGVAGSSDPRSTRGRFFYYQRVLEQWLHSNGRVLAMRGMSSAQFASAKPVLSPVSGTRESYRSVITLDKHIDTLAHAPRWVQSVAEYLERLGSKATPYDGSIESVGFEASADPVMAYSRRFTPQQTAVLWINANFRAKLKRLQTPKITPSRLARLTISTQSLELTNSKTNSPDIWSSFLDISQKNTSDACTNLQKIITEYQATNNPYALRQVTSYPTCKVTALIDKNTGVTWLGIVRRAKEVRLLLFPIVRGLTRTEPLKLSRDELPAHILVPTRNLEVSP